MALAGTNKAKDFNQVTRTNGLDAWRKLVVPLRPRSEAKRNALHTSVHAPPKSKDLSEVIADVNEWEKTVRRFELCGGVISDSDKRTVLLKRLPVGTSSNLVSALRLQEDYESMKNELDDQIW